MSYEELDELAVGRSGKVLDKGKMQSENRSHDFLITCRDLQILRAHDLNMFVLEDSLPLCLDLLSKVLSSSLVATPATSALHW